ncbi:hypothetical protein FPOAC2_01465 [Fusarium poae]|jgi:hypothetical protein
MRKRPSEPLFSNLVLKSILTECEQCLHLLSLLCCREFAFAPAWALGNIKAAPAKDQPILVSIFTSFITARFAIARSSNRGAIAVLGLVIGIFKIAPAGTTRHMPL